MDDNTRDVLIAAVTVAGAFVTGVVVAGIGFWQAHRLGERSAGREDARLRETIRREDDRLRDAEAQRERERWASEKRVAYVRFTALDAVSDTADDYDRIEDAGAVLLDKYRRLCAVENEVELVAPSSVRPYLRQARQAMGTRALNAIAERSGDPIAPQSLDPARVVGRFVAAASLDLQGKPIPDAASLDEGPQEAHPRRQVTTS